MSVISKQMRIRGDCVVEGKIRIEGRIAGNVRAEGLELVESGSVEGDLSAADDGGSFVIAGRVDGSVRAGRVDVASTGVILNGVEAEEAHVRGRIEGGVLARRRLVLEETAVVEGDVRATKLALKEGGQVNGTIVMGDRATAEDGAGGQPEPTSPEGGAAGVADAGQPPPGDEGAEVDLEGAANAAARGQKDGRGGMRGAGREQKGSGRQTNEDEPEAATTSS